MTCYHRNVIWRQWICMFVHLCVCAWAGVSVRDASVSVGNEHHQLLNHPGGANGVHRPHFSATTAVHKHKTNKNVNKKGNTQTSVVSSCNVVLSLPLSHTLALVSWQQQERGAGVHTSVYYPDKHKSRQNNTKYLKISILWRNICCSNNNLHKLVNTGVRHSVSVASANKQRKSQKQNNSRTTNNNNNKTTAISKQLLTLSSSRTRTRTHKESVLGETANSGLKIN